MVSKRLPIARTAVVTKRPTGPNGRKAAMARKEAGLWANWHNGHPLNPTEPHGTPRYAKRGACALKYVFRQASPHLRFLVFASPYPLPTHNVAVVSRRRPLSGMAAWRNRKERSWIVGRRAQRTAAEPHRAPRKHTDRLKYANVPRNPIFTRIHPPLFRPLVSPLLLLLHLPTRNMSVVSIRLPFVATAGVGRG